MGGSGVDITITGLTIDKTGGDGIQTGAGTEGGDRTGGATPGTPGTRTKNVVIRSVILSNNHRQVRCQWNNPDLLFKNPDLRWKNGLIL